MMINLNAIALAMAALASQPSQDEKAELNDPVLTPYIVTWGVRDTNIDRDQNKIHSTGFVYGAGLEYRSDGDKPLFEATYEIAKHSYSNFDEFDRVSHELTGIYHHKFSDLWRADMLVELSSKGSSEDRDVNDTLSLQPRFEYRISDDDRLKLRGNYRWRTPPDDRNGKNQNRYAEFIYEKKLPNNNSVAAGVRYEINRAASDVNHFDRVSYSIEWEAEPTPRDQLSIELKFRDREYTVREVTKGVKRQDDSFVVSADWEHFFNDKLSLLLDYRMETRRSNDDGASFVQHVLGVGAKLRF